MPTRVLIVGAGAIGAFFGSRLSTVPHVLVSAVCRSNYDAVKANGFTVRSPKYGEHVFKPEFTFANPEESRQMKREKGLKWDYLLVATKALPDVSDGSLLLEGLVDDATSIVLVQNGLGIEEPYYNRFPKATILSAVTNASAVQPSPGLIEHNRWTKISIGPFFLHHGSAGAEKVNHDQISRERNHTFVELLKAGEISDAEAYDEIGLQFSRWHKVAINAAMNPSAVLSGGAGNRELSQDSELAIHAKAVMNEVLDAAPKIMGKAPPWKELKLATPDQVLDSVGRNTSGSRPSMWWDWAEGRRMELEVILGNPLRMAREKGIDMPRVQSLYALLKKAQEKRAAAKESKL